MGSRHFVLDEIFGTSVKNRNERRTLLHIWQKIITI
jgi:hypothetical protein